MGRETQEEPPWLMPLTLGALGLVPGGVVLGVLWITSRLFLHDRMGWLVWVPVIGILGLILLGLTRGREDHWAQTGLSLFLVVTGFVLLPIVAPFVLAAQQNSAEARYVEAVREAFRPTKMSPRAPIAEHTFAFSGDELTTYAWEVCDGLGAIRNGKSDIEDGQEPSAYLAEFIKYRAYPDVNITDTVEDIQLTIELADEYVCYLGSPFPFPR